MPIIGKYFCCRIKDAKSGWCTNQDIAADIISIIRQQALGSPLVSHETRIRAAVAKLQQFHKRLRLLLSYFVVGNSKIRFNYSRSFMELL